jgi:hypothetical protein
MSMPVLKMVFGYMLLVVLASLAAAIALGNVQQESSHGLDQILGGLLVISGAFAHWAFGEPDERVPNDRKQVQKTQAIESNAANS